LFNLEDYIPPDHLLGRINPVVTGVLADLREKLASFYSDIGRPSVDPELKHSLKAISGQRFRVFLSTS